jgi:hypothetical protein
MNVKISFTERISPIIIKLVKSFSDLSAFGSQYFFSQIIILFLPYSHIRSPHDPKVWPIQDLIFNILFLTCWLHPLKFTSNDHAFFWMILFFKLYLTVHLYLYSIQDGQQCINVRKPISALEFGKTSIISTSTHSLLFKTSYLSQKNACCLTILKKDAINKLEIKYWISNPV